MTNKNKRKHAKYGMQQKTITVTRGGKEIEEIKPWWRKPIYNTKGEVTGYEIAERSDKSNLVRN